MEEEVWKPIPDYEGLYEASSEGRIRSVNREVAGKAGSVRILKGKVLKPAMTRDDYLQVQLCKGGEVKKFYVHRLVWMAFNGEIPDGYEVNHINEDKTNNKLENINLLTHKENINFGTRNERCSKPVIALDEDGKIVFQFQSIMDAWRNGFHRSNLLACCRGKLKTHRGLRWEYKIE